MDQNLQSTEESRRDTSSTNERIPAWRYSADHVRDPADKLNIRSELSIYTKPGIHLNMTRVKLYCGLWVLVWGGWGLAVRSQIAYWPYETMVGECWSSEGCMGLGGWMVNRCGIVVRLVVYCGCWTLMQESKCLLQPLEQDVLTLFWIKYNF